MSLPSSTILYTFHLRSFQILFLVAKVRKDPKTQDWWNPPSSTTGSCRRPRSGYRDEPRLPSSRWGPSRQTTFWVLPAAIGSSLCLHGATRIRPSRRRASTSRSPTRRIWIGANIVWRLRWKCDVTQHFGPFRWKRCSDNRSGRLRKGLWHRRP